MNLEENLTSYKHPQNGIPQLFSYNVFLIASNGTESRVGTITADWEQFLHRMRDLLLPCHPSGQIRVA